MHRRLGFVLSIGGMTFIVMPLATVLGQSDFVVCVIGFSLTLLGIFLALESVAKKKP